MKKAIFLLIFFVSTGQMAFAQKGQRQERIKALKIAFITQKLHLTADEAKKFWPVYNKYENEIEKLMANAKENDVLENEEKLLKIRKHYQPSFQRILGKERVNTLFNAERQFRLLLIQKLKERRRKHNNR